MDAWDHTESARVNLSLVPRLKPDEEEVNRSCSAASGDQQSVRAGEIDPSRSSEHAPPMVGASAAGGGTSGDLRADGGRSFLAPGHLPDREEAGEGTSAALPDHRGSSALGEHH